MIYFYYWLVMMLTLGVCIVALPFIKHQSVISKSAFFTFLTFIIASSGLYYYLGQYDDLKQWLTQGKAHYELQVQLNALGGIDGIIQRVTKKLSRNPHDAQGWFILGKLYLMREDRTNARMAFKKAHDLAPKDPIITDFYHKTQSP